jgi:hypothetical protein
MAAASALRSSLLLFSRSEQKSLSLLLFGRRRAIRRPSVAPQALQSWGVVRTCRRPWRRWPGRGADVVLRSGDPPTALSSEARSDFAEGVVDAEGAVAPFDCQGLSLQDRFIL